ncbi:unnamed protein product [Orchesella dallaii]|uniref:Uncharacterized protein n=1 Tax=Orchesella dallaii TaxID=48710 RepID=A0ABP1QE16_9HEXA
MDNSKGNPELELASSSSRSSSDAVRNEDAFLEQELLVSGAVPNVLNFTKLKGSQMVLDCSSYFGKPRTVVINREQSRTVITSHGGYSQAGNKDILLVVNEGPELNHVVVDVIDECIDIAEEPAGQREKSTLAESIGGACIKNASGETDGISFSGTGEYQQFLHVESCIKEGTEEKNDDAITMDRNDVGDLEVPGVFNAVVDPGQDVNSSNEVQFKMKAKPNPQSSHI